MSEEVKISITADSASAEGQLKGTAAGVASVGTTATAAAPAVRGLAGTIDTLRLSLTTLQKAFGLLGIITLTISWLTALWGVCKTAYGWFKKLGETSVTADLDRMAAAAKAAADDWKSLNDEMARGAELRKALAEDQQKQADATLGLDLANIEAKLQKDLAATTDPAEREDLTAAADAAKTARTNKASEDAARAARANAQAELIQNQKDIEKTRKALYESSNPTPMPPAVKKKEATQKALIEKGDEIKALDSDYAYLKKQKPNMDPRVYTSSVIQNRIDRGNAVADRDKLSTTLPNLSKAAETEDEKKYNQIEEARKKLNAEALVKAQKLLDERTRLQKMVGITDTRVSEAEQIARNSKSQADREAADRQAAAEGQTSAGESIAPTRQAAAEAPASASESSAPDSNAWFSRAQARAAAAREIADLEASIADTGKTPARSAALRAARERAAAAADDSQKAIDDLNEKQSAASLKLAQSSVTDQSQRDKILASAAEKRSSITVDAPRAATDVGAIGGYMGGNMQNAARMAEQRAAALEAIQREAATLLAQIKEGLTE
jgi:hypothetical protein